MLQFLQVHHRLLLPQDRKNLKPHKSLLDNRELFKFTFSNKNFIGTIKGCDEVSLNYATFIKDYLERR